MENVKFPFKVEMVEMKDDGWAVKIFINAQTIQQAHQIGETMAAFLDEMNSLNKDQDS